MVAIFVILTILLFVGIDAILQRRRQHQHALAPEPPPARSWAPQLPAGLFLHPGHTWAEIYASGLVRMGLDDLVARLVGHVDRVRLRMPGEKVRRGEEILALEQSGRTLSLVAPVSGTIERVNNELLERPEAISNNPFREGWAYAIRPSRLGEEIGELKVAENARSWLADELQRCIDWLNAHSGRAPSFAMQDGGTPVEGVLGHLDNRAWEAFQHQFLAV